MILRPLTVDDKAEAIRAHHEMAPDGFDFLLDSTGFYDESGPWEAYLGRLSSLQNGEFVPESWVSSTFLVAEVDGQIVGRVSIRHQLNDFLETRGGHIGYGVRPAYRGRGHATEILQNALKIARELGVRRVLVTCDDANAASSKVIERAGGVLENIFQEGDEKIRRYWIAPEPSL
jgi:predicted acetyltransferase